MALDNNSLKVIEYELSVMKPRQKLFKLVQSEMQKRGHWKFLPRGRAFKKRS